MKVMCIDDRFLHKGEGEEPSIGEIVTVAGQCEVYPDNWDISEYPTDYIGNPWSFRKNLFAPLSDIDENELVNHKTEYVQ